MREAKNLNRILFIVGKLKFSTMTKKKTKKTKNKLLFLCYAGEIYCYVRRCERNVEEKILCGRLHT